MYIFCHFLQHKNPGSSDNTTHVVSFSTTGLQHRDKISHSAESRQRESRLNNILNVTTKQVLILEILQLLVFYMQKRTVLTNNNWISYT